MSANFIYNVPVMGQMHRNMMAIPATDFQDNDYCNSYLWSLKIRERLLVTTYNLLSVVTLVCAATALKFAPHPAALAPAAFAGGICYYNLAKISPFLDDCNTLFKAVTNKMSTIRNTVLPVEGGTRVPYTLGLFRCWTTVGPEKTRTN